MTFVTPPQDVTLDRLVSCLVEITLLQCQKDAADEFVSNGGRAYVDAAVGSGKTFLACEIIRRAEYPALYITTKSNLAKKNHPAEFERFGLKTTVIDMSMKDRVKLWKDPPMNRVYMATPNIFNRPYKEWVQFRKIPWKTVVIDESDEFTGSASKRNRRLLELKPRHRLFMSGTPLKNGLKDSFMPLMFLSESKPWKNWTDFSNRELLHNNPRVPNQITGIRDENHLASLMSPLMIKMVNKDAPKELKIEEISVPMLPEQERAYRELEKTLILEIENGTLIMSNRGILNLRMRQFVTLPEALGHPAKSAKEQALFRAMPKMNGKTIIFTSFATVAEILGERYGWEIITGKLSAKRRKEIVDLEPDVIIATAAAERGINLPLINNVVSLDRGFTEAVMRQRAGRVTRYGRKGKARCFLLTCPGTVDIKSQEKIVLRKIKESRKIWQEKTQ